ncbi:hypothetical protein, partial [Niastella yeongjuensis]|uniref:hypothetical protein n=1 Tax=Niastella yeongjuensis TaxID=354355 RepID=UPI001A99A01D
RLFAFYTSLKKNLTSLLNTSTLKTNRIFIIQYNICAWHTVRTSKFEVDALNSGKITKNPMVHMESV